MTLFGVTTEKCAQETGLPASLLRCRMDVIERDGFRALFRPSPKQIPDHHRSLPVPMRQLLVDLNAENPAFSNGELAQLCEIHCFLG